MIELRPFASLGGANHGWLDTKHHFSFADYHDDARVHWGNLRVWNDEPLKNIDAVCDAIIRTIGVEKFE